MHKNKLIVLLYVFATLAPRCNASNNSAAFLELGGAGNAPTNAPLLNLTQPSWKTHVYNYVTSPAPFSRLGDACLAAVLTTSGISAKLINDKDQNSCSNNEAINLLNITTLSLAGVAFTAYCTGMYLRKKNRS